MKPATDAEIMMAARIVRRMFDVPADQRMDVVAIAVDAFIRSNGGAHTNRDDHPAIKGAGKLANDRESVRELLGTLLYWHDHGGIDESWWQAAREMVIDAP